MSNKILIASDHAGYDLKKELIEKLPQIMFVDLGTKTNKSVDYTDYANVMAKKVSSDNNLTGILICGTGVGMSVAANKYSNIRAGLAFNSEIAKLIRKHNDANILVLPGRYMDIQEAKKCINNFISTAFEGGRHSQRLSKMIKGS